MFVATLGNTWDYRLRDNSPNLHEDEHFKFHNVLNPFKMSRQGNCANFRHVNTNLANEFGGTRWRSWLRHCAKSRKVAGSVIDGVIGIFR
jgi:hypothetical protein